MESEKVMNLKFYSWQHVVTRLSPSRPAGVKIKAPGYYESFYCDCKYYYRGKTTSFDYLKTASLLLLEICLFSGKLMNFESHFLFYILGANSKTIRDLSAFLRCLSGAKFDLWEAPTSSGRQWRRRAFRRVGNDQNEYFKSRRAKITKL